MTSSPEITSSNIPTVKRYLCGFKYLKMPRDLSNDCFEIFFLSLFSSFSKIIVPANCLAGTKLEFDLVNQLYNCHKSLVSFLNFTRFLQLLIEFHGSIISVFVVWHQLSVLSIPSHFYPMFCKGWEFNIFYWFE